MITTVQNHKQFGGIIGGKTCNDFEDLAINKNISWSNRIK